MTETHHSRILIIGAGPAGYTAAIYAARAGLQPLLVAGLEPGGQLTITTDVENYPGFAEVIQGPWLMEQMAAQAENVGTRIVPDVIVEVDFSARPFRCRGDSGDTYVADAVILATGAQARWLGIESEERLQGRGVSACATCDGFFYRGKRVAVVGGGNTAVEEALYLTHHADHVTLIHRRDALRAEKILQARLFVNPKISVVWDSVVDEILGGGSPETVEGVRLRNATHGTYSVLPVDGVFIAIGHTPNTAIFAGQVAMDAGRLRGDHARQHAHLATRRVCRGRCAGQGVSPGGDRGGHRLHGGAGSGEIPGRRSGGARRCRPGGGKRPGHGPEPGFAGGGLVDVLGNGTNLAHQTRARSFNVVVCGRPGGVATGKYIRRRRDRPRPDGRGKGDGLG